MKRAKGIVDKNGMKWAMDGVPADRTAPNGFREKPKAAPLLDKSKATALLQYYGNVTVNPDAGKVTIKMPKRDAPACSYCGKIHEKRSQFAPCPLESSPYQQEPKPAEPSCVCAETGARNCPVHNEPAADERPALREWWFMFAPGSNRALIREPGEKWPDDLNGKPNGDWIHVREVKKS